MQLTFYGGVKRVTGSNYLLESGETKILVDCGLYQESHYAERENFEPFAYSPKDIDAVFVTHAHLDHVGRLPGLFEGGFRGTIYSTPPTKDCAELILVDSQGILCKEAEREGFKADICAPEAIEGVMSHWKKIPYHQKIQVGPFEVELYDAGHILGSATVVVRAEGKTVVFSGDLGNFPPPIIKSTEYVDAADYCLIESTYGDRVHEDVNRRREMLEDVIEDTVKAKGVLMIPSFALERTQELLYHLHSLFEQGRIPRIPVFMDSPLAIKLTAIYEKYTSYFNSETDRELRRGEDILNFPGLHLTLTTEESKRINDVPAPKIIIAGSGMSHGGRILHHERRYLSDPKNTILFVGYQAVGSLGRKIFEGAQSVRIFGEEVPVRCVRRAIGAYSAHADQPRLLEWLSHMRGGLKEVFVVQGEETASNTLAQKIKDEMAIQAIVPDLGQSVTL
jgi:metallo-beta-lactamase family protein